MRLIIALSIIFVLILSSVVSTQNQVFASHTSKNWFWPNNNSIRNPKPTITPKPTPKLTPKPSLKPTIKPIPTLNIITPTSQVATNQSVEGFLLGAINDYRKSQGLSTVQTDPYTCNFAQVRAGEIVNAFNHDGFSSRINSKSLPYPSYHSVIENIAKNSNYKNVVQSWINSPGHAQNMRSDTPYVCVKAQGAFYAYEGWKP